MDVSTHGETTENPEARRQVGVLTSPNTIAAGESSLGVDRTHVTTHDLRHVVWTQQRRVPERESGRRKCATRQNSFDALFHRCDSSDDATVAMHAAVGIDPPVAAGSVYEIETVGSTRSVANGRPKHSERWLRHTCHAADLALRRLNSAVARHRPGAGLLHHTDRGSTYTAAAYRSRLSELAMTQSMSRRGNCWDNAIAESTIGSIKVELFDRVPVDTTMFGTNCSSTSRASTTDIGCTLLSTTSRPMRSSSCWLQRWQRNKPVH